MMDQEHHRQKIFVLAGKIFRGYMYKFYAATLSIIIVLSIGAADAQLPKFFTDARKIILEQYINPRNADLKKWDRDLEVGALRLCQPTCNEENLNAYLGERVQAIGDPHFYLYDPLSVRTMDALGVGDFRHSMKFGFILENALGRNVIRYIHPNTPAAALLKMGDFILSAKFVVPDSAIDAQPVPIVLSMAERHGKGVDITLERSGQRLTVRVYPNGESWISTAEVIQKNVLWLRLTATDNNAQQFVYDSVRRAKADEIKGIILDLRLNQGGQPFKTVNIAGAFVAKLGLTLKNRTGQAIRYDYAEGKVTYANEATGQREQETIGNAALWDGPLAVLVSRNTFSGGENLASILKSARRAKVIGEPSRGGGGVTGNEFTLKDQLTMFVPQYRHYDAAGVPRPLQVIPDQLLGLQNWSTLVAGDQWLAAAVAALQLK